MATKGSRSKTAVKTATVHEMPAQVPATVADIEVAATLIPSSRKAKGWTADGKLVETFANPLMQDRLRGIETELTVLGIDIETPLAFANEGQKLQGALERLDQSTGRVQQRVVEINKRLFALQTQLLRLKGSAAPNSTIVKALQGLAGLRAKQTTKAKTARTKARRAKAKAAAKKPPAI